MESARIAPKENPNNVFYNSFLAVILCSVSADNLNGETRCRQSRQGWTPAMIKLTRLNNNLLVVNCDLIKTLENAPDTVLTLVTGEKIIVRETTEQVLERVIAFRRAVLAGLAPSVTDLPILIPPEPRPPAKPGESS